MILYAVVSNGRSVLAEHSERELPDSIPASTRALLAKIGADSARRMSYQLGAEHHVHYVLDDGVTFLCMTGAGAKWRVAFAYLEEVRTRFNYSFTSSSPSCSRSMASPAPFSLYRRIWSRSTGPNSA